MSRMPHGMELRTPWYDCVRGGFDRFEPPSSAPSIQMYDRDDFVDRLVTDPQDSLAFDDQLADVWTFAVPRSATDKPKTVREMLSPYRLATSNVRKLYQPSHQRFYALTVELFCDLPGLPRPGPADDVEVRFVIRRIRTTFTNSGKNDEHLKALARAAAEELFAHRYPAMSKDITGDDARDLATLYGVQSPDRAKLLAFEQKHASLLAKVGRAEQEQGWFVGDDGQGSWETVPVPNKSDDPVPDGEEQGLPMWRIPPSAAGCEPAKGRSLWFGVVPTYSGELDRQGRPKLDERTTYVLRCVARRRQPPERKNCPDVVTTSSPTRPYRLAAFFDPAGTANRRIHVRLPDFAAVAARAAAGPLSGGVEFERPARSQLSAGPLGKIPEPASGRPGGESAENCVFAIELITIVATFVLMLFMPIVVFVFQLWWLLLLKFCWPRPQSVADLLTALSVTSINGLAAGGVPEKALRDLLGVQDDQRNHLFEPDATVAKTQAPVAGGTDPTPGRQFIDGLQAEAAPPVPAGVPLPSVTDPLCG